MNTFEDHIKKAAAEYSLSESEKARMDRVISEYLRFKPLRGGHRAPPMRIPIVAWISYLHRPLAAALVMVLATSGSLSYAAESALPGDVLYAVKTVVNEPARVAFARDAEAKAEVHITLAERRIEEAAALAAVGRLDEEKRETLAVAFESQANAATKRIEETEVENASAALELATRFETRLEAHEQIIAAVETEEEPAETTDEPREHSLAEAVRARSTQLAQWRLASRFPRDEDRGTSTAAAIAITSATGTEIALMTGAALENTATSSDESEKKQEAHEETEQDSNERVIRMQRAATESLERAKEVLDDARRLPDEVRERAEENLAHAEALLEDAEDDNTTALASFEESFRLSEQTIVHIKTAPLWERLRARWASMAEQTATATTSQATTTASSTKPADETPTTTNTLRVDISLEQR